MDTVRPPFKEIPLSTSDAHAAPPPRYMLDRVSEEVRTADLGEMVRTGLTATPKWLSPFVFYDARGSELFEQICALDAYYVTRTEAEIFQRHSPDILEAAGRFTTIYELGSGSSVKSEILLEAALQRGGPVRYVPTDISEAALVEASDRLTARWPQLEVHGIVCSYHDAVRAVHERFPGPFLGLFMGGNIGNFAAGNAVQFLSKIRSECDPDDRFVAGFDRVKDPRILVQAYDDPQGVTAEFNRNALAHINRRFAADFDLASFRHQAIWNPELSRIEMHLESQRDQQVHLRELGLTVRFRAGETIHTENSHKYTPESFTRMARQAGWIVDRTWGDGRDYFCVAMLKPDRTQGGPT